MRRDAIHRKRTLAIAPQLKKKSVVFIFWVNGF
jgi:hypothetical protein